MKKLRKINCLGFLSLLALLAVLGWKTENTGLYGFFGFAYFIRYFWVIPDELFYQNVQKACTFALLSELILLVPFMFICTMLHNAKAAVPVAFGLSFAAAIFSFSIVLAVLEWKERKGAME